MSKRAYGQFCGISRALELIGERWTLLIVRDLLVGPRRYTDLRIGLPGIPTNVLSDRLKDLERNDLVRRSLQARPGGAVVYELTDYGRQLEPAVLQLGKWGAGALTDPGPDEVVTPDSLVMALRTTFEPTAAVGVHAVLELRFGEVVVHAHIDDGRLEVHPGGPDTPDLVIEAGPVLRAVMAGEVAADDAVAGGDVTLTGDETLFARFAELFPIKPRPPVAAA
ncbi:winged helix-turn-helix transcriptional regulator [Dactylosporangium maewongense]|uniref:Winged helix-turn-helix transcriptional regulator n=1 Tax=Dactylosporangium maewongense TaxID=634393 RepID=A0ABP4MNN6_9ACTN